KQNTAITGRRGYTGAVSITNKLEFNSDFNGLLVNCDKKYKIKKYTHLLT
ncbi:MAG: hypothetical protein JWQ66_1138, partial [Mucilaginibacter sp.]|nr:hypothetical protein [Mucilaginibacter sp.]